MTVHVVAGCVFSLTQDSGFLSGLVHEPVREVLQDRRNIGFSGKNCSSSTEFSNRGKPQLGRQTTPEATVVTGIWLVIWAHLFPGRKEKEKKEETLVREDGFLEAVTSVRRRLLRFLF